ncbi:hypothetical protein CMUS01_14663 [Colletotrichum musicola]|uniref:Heterokaryon incompatibility domain-containing protein n=1 Tax=Colletotrichum musicola TaxID=2175873 RepID=A0A8H6MR94_9PEZI|nr:hypothetical protein CMUS01_14663 [Colletotrichum musicola]
MGIILNIQHEQYHYAADRESYILCESCTKFEFDRFASNPASQGPAAAANSITLDLLRVIKNYKGNKCRFCSLLFDAIAAHDPFEAPAIKDYMPDDLKGQTFRQWGNNWKRRLWPGGAGHPFGKCRDVVKFKPNHASHPSAPNESPPTGPRPSRQIPRGAAVFEGQVAAAKSSVHLAIDQSKNSSNEDLAGMLDAVQDMIPPVVTLVGRANRNLPAAVSVQQTGGGLFTVGVWGFGNAPNPPLSCLSTFNLLVAQPHPRTEGGCLRYASTLGDRIDVKGTFRNALTHCMENHPRCCQPNWAKSLEPPGGRYFKLIDVYEKKIVSCKLLTGRQPNKQPPPYAALSYVWGKTGDNFFKLKTEHLHEDNEDADIPIGSMSLPATISDAMEVTRQLNEGHGDSDTQPHIRHIWVDSLCIIQDGDTRDGDITAQQSQIEQMDRIYGHATVVLVAAGGSDANAGIHGVTRDRKYKPEQISRQIRPGVDVLLPVQYPTDYGTWDSRAWTLQEKLLSKRLLVFGETYASFHCHHRNAWREDMSAGDAGNGPAPIDFLSPPTTQVDIGTSASGIPGQMPVIYRSALFSEYAKILGQYTSRSLTQPRDILAGMTGLLNILDASDGSQSPTADSTLSGLPERFLDLALLWQPPAAEGVGLNRRVVSERVPVAKGGTSNPDFQFPSWSWAGWDTVCDNGVQNHTGVRFEDPFWVSTYPDLSLRKMAVPGFSMEPEERYRPLVMWYTTKAKDAPPMHKERFGVRKSIDHLRGERAKLRPVNGHGLGLRFEDPGAAAAFRRRALQLRGGNDKVPRIPEDVRLRDYYLVCEGEVATFEVSPAREPRVEFLWRVKQEGRGHENSQRLGLPRNLEDGERQDFEVVRKHSISEHNIKDHQKDVVGYLVPTNRQQQLNGMKLDFLLLSESQYWGNEARVDIDDFSYYNVMMIEWDSSGSVASRLGLGKVRKEAWVSANPILRTVILK